MEKLDEQDLRNNLNYYKQKTEVYRQKVEDQGEFFDKLIDFSPEQYAEKLTRVQNFLMDVWAPDEPQIEQQAPHKNNFPIITKPQQQQDYDFGGYQNFQKHPHPQQQQNNSSRGNEQENQPAFRRLFEEGDELMAETSPQFKKI